ncbi:MAG TPA: J domain-containing protein [Candidatus Acidoferrales bacterium]|nr:J domain-containing protein [Candidatus Acidoferrales bacterium]
MTWQEAFRILELSNPKTLEEVREAYNVQAKAWHPDRFEGDTKMQRIGTAKLKLINEAFKLVKENWDRRGSFHSSYEFPKALEPARRGKSKVPSTGTGPRDLVTVSENDTVLAKKTNITVGAKRVHEYLGDAVITVIFPDHRSRELKMKVGDAATVDFGKSAKFEIRLLQVRHVYKSRRGMPFPLFYPAADLAVTKIG